MLLFEKYFSSNGILGVDSFNDSLEKTAGFGGVPSLSHLDVEDMCHIESVTGSSVTFGPHESEKKNNLFLKLEAQRTPGQREREGFQRHTSSRHVS